MLAAAAGGVTATARRAAGHRRRWGSITGIPRFPLALEGAIGLLGFAFAVVFEKPIPIRAPMQREADGPRLGENLRVVDGGFVLNRVWAGHSIPLDDMEHIAMKIPRHVEPGLIVLARDVDHQRVAIPMPPRIAHPGIHAEGVGVVAAIRVDQPIVERPFERHRNRARRLENLKRKVEVHDPWHAGNVALPERVGLQAILKVRRFLRERRRLIRNRAAAHDDRSSSLHVVSRNVILQIRRGGAGSLPDAFEVRFAIRRAGQARLRRSGDKRNGEDCSRDRDERLDAHNGQK